MQNHHEITAPRYPVVRRFARCGRLLQQPRGPQDYSGFLKDYSRLQEAKSPSGAPVMRWIDPKVNINQYSQVFIEPSQFYPKPQATAVILSRR